MESEFLYHSSCSNCGSRDNLGVYTDHVYCFGCGFYNSEKHPSAKLLNRKGKNETRLVVLPPDCSRDIPDIGRTWCANYDLDWSDLVTHRFLWSHGGIVLKDGTLFAPCLIFPVYDVYGNLLLWQGRYFGTEKAPKYYTRGGRDCIHIIGKGGPINVVEDMVSAIKISRVARGIPLFGSNLSIDFLLRLHRITDRFNIWLDSDKIQYARKVKQRAMQFFAHVGVIHTPLDPKCYTTAEIQTIMGATE